MYFCIKLNYYAKAFNTYFHSYTFAYFFDNVLSTTPDSILLTLSKVEQCMDAHPDSALNLLKRIPNPESLYGKAQADYCLLMTQAMDKNYIKLTSDSLILFAVNYYGFQDENIVAKGKSFFYCGRVMKELKRQEDAMEYFLKAKSVFDSSSEYRIKGLISEEIGGLNWKQDMYEEALQNYRDSRRYYEMAGDVLCLSYALRNIGRVYLALDSKSDSAYVYYQEALQVAHNHNCSSEFSILQELGMIYRARKDYEKSEYYLLQSIQLDNGKRALTGIYLSLGYTYFQMGNKVAAEKYLKLSTQAADIMTQVDAYNSLYKLEKSRNSLMLAIEYKESSDSLRKIAQNREVRETVADLQKKYENEKLQKDNLQIKIEYKNVLLFCSFLSFFIVLLLCYYFYKLRTNRKQMREIELTIVSNKEAIYLYQIELATFQHKQSESEDHRTKIGELNGKVIILSMQNKELNDRLNKLRGEVPAGIDRNDSIYVAAFRSLLALKNESFRGELSRTDWEHLFELLDYLYAGFVNRLRDKYPALTRHDIEICCLLKFQFSNDELSRVFLTASESVTKAKGRLKKRLNMPPLGDLDEFIQNF